MSSGFSSSWSMAPKRWRASRHPGSAPFLAPSVQDSGATASGKTRVSTSRIALARPSALRREPCALSELCVGVECGHSDATSGLVCNPLAGAITEAVVAAGGQAMFSETVEWTGAESTHLFACHNPPTAEEARAGGPGRSGEAAK